jgi:hypothetical protein
MLGGTPSRVRPMTFGQRVVLSFIILAGSIWAALVGETFVAVLLVYIVPCMWSKR